jgi:hypothetical protein
VNNRCAPLLCNGCTCLWGKCGGKSEFNGKLFRFKGEECCDQGSTCVKQNDFYSQCRPLPAGR